MKTHFIQHIPSPEKVFPLFKVVAGLFLLGAMTSGITIGIIRAYPQMVGLAKNTQQSDAELNALITEVGKLMELPQSERPIVATVDDANKVQSQQFFKNAQNGDRVLIYSNARKAILYRPADKRIIEVGTVNRPEENNTSDQQNSEEILDEVFPLESSSGANVSPSTPVPTQAQ